MKTARFPLALRVLLTAYCLLPTACFVGLAPEAKAQVPGPELFAKEPRTPLELWEAIDYLVRTGQAKKAVPYLDKFVKSAPDDATMVAVRNQYGLGSILRLNDDPATQPFAEPIAKKFAEAAHTYATRPERIAQFIDQLVKSPEEQDYAIRHLRESGPDAVPFLVDALSRPDLPADERKRLVDNMGRLDRSAVPPLIATLDSPDPTLAATAATLLGKIGDKAVVPFLTFAAASAGSPPPLRNAAQAAIAQLTGQPFSSQPRNPVQALTAAAWNYHRHQVEFPDDRTTVWSWDKERKTPAPKEVSRSEAEAIAGLRLAREALRLDPTNRDAQVVQISLALEKGIERVGYAEFPAKDPATFAAATASGPSILGVVLKTAIADRKTDLAAAAAKALGQVTNVASLSAAPRPHPLVDALYAPGRRVQFAAAKALVNLAPSQAFAGSSRVVPTLARFVSNQAQPRAIVIDGNPTRGSQIAGFLVTLGYDSELELTGLQGFVAAAEAADVELILVSFDLFTKGWALPDTLANLEADSRTAAIPVFVYGPLELSIKRPNLPLDYPGTRFLVTPMNADLLKKQLDFKKLPPALGEAERAAYAREAAELLARIAAERKGPLAAGLTAAEPALAVALGGVQPTPSVAKALGEVPDPDAQRSLADLVLDPSQDPSLRSQTAAQIVRSIQQFGPLISADQEKRLAASLRDETNPVVMASLGKVLDALMHKQPDGSTRPPGPPKPVTSPKPAPPPAPATPPEPGS
jgi:HEAT repeat protein